MSRKIYIGEDNLINLKNAMAGKNIGHSTFMQEDKPPYERDEFTINPEGGANDNFHIGDDAINEHHLDQRLPFDENEFSRKRYIEQYVDWLEEFGRYGELPNGTLDFWEEIAKAVKVIREKTLHGRFDSSLPLNKTDEEIVEELRNRIIGPYLNLEGGKVYVERAIKIDKSPRAYYNGKEPKNDELYTKLINTYNDNVGGCWSYKGGGAQAYCSDSGNEYEILLCGFIRTDDIDFIKTVQLNYHYEDEHEIRVNPFAKIELESIGYNSSSNITFDRHLIVSATYSGNKSKSNILGFTKVDDGFGGIKYFDRRTRQEVTKDDFYREIKNHLENGENPRNIFDDVYDFNNGLSRVKLNHKFNLINREGCFISDQWFDYIGDFKEGVAGVEINGKSNFINQEGELLSDQWFDNACNFSEGLAKVFTNGKCNFINQEGELLSDQWFDNANNFKEGFACVLLNGKWNFINEEGELLCSQWLDWAYEFSEGFAMVRLNGGKYNFINQEGELLSDQWFDGANNFREGLAKVLLNGKYNFINQEGRFLSDQWFDGTYSFNEGLVVVKLSGKWNFMNQEGELLCDQWLDGVSEFVNGFATAIINGKFNLINREGELLCDQWLDWIGPFREGFAMVRLNGKYNFIKQEGGFISDQWFDNANSFNNGFADVRINRKTYYLDTNGNLTPLSESKKRKKIIMTENKLIAIKENLENEVEANEVSLDSFKKQKELATKIWNGDKLNSRVRLKLLDIADDFWETTDIGWVKPKGIVLMGSICNYNWSKSSDIDLHLQVDFSEVDEKKDFVQEYFNGKKNEWNEEHSSLKIFGFPVELYVEDIDADTNSGGIYDLEENDWIKKPSKDGIKQIGLDKYNIKDKSAKIMTDIDDLYGLFKKTDDDAKLRKIGEKAHDLLGKIKAMRKDGLSRGGESDKDNIIYKVLRRTGYMDILWNLSSQLYDKLNSIDESVKTISEESERDNDLISYFNWAKSATDAEKACDFAKRYPEVTGRFIGSRIRYFSQFEDLYLRLKRDKSLLNDDSFIEEFGKIVEECRILDDYLTFAKIQINLFNEPKNKIPTWMYMKLNRIVDNEWCIHFCNNAKAIASEGFKWGTKNVDSLSFTDSGAEKEGVGYNFAFPIGEYSINSNGYGSFRFKNNNIEKCSQEAVIFKTSGVEVEHTGDEQRQVIFWGGDAKNIIPIEYDYKNKTWVLLNRNGELMCSGRPSEILDWVVNNSSKVIPESVLKDIMSMSLLNEEVVADGNADHNPFKKRWKYERETLINYLTNYGEIMTSKENGKQYKVLFDDMLSSRIGLNYCLCIQWNPMTMEPGSVIYVRALDKFTRKIFKPEFDTRGFDNVSGTYDDVV